MGRSRASRKAGRYNEKLDTSWMVYTKCWMCGKEFVVNNYSDHKVRIAHSRVGGLIVCIWCKTRGNESGRQWVQLYMLAKRTAKMGCTRDQAEDCKCPPCVARRLTEHIESTRPPERFYRKRVSVSSGEV